ncbi:MAG: isocitrate lyase [SAR202 cluster bacterium]|nr:isocitrate lyase [SAR202 cluster bacterium]|tara:strand:+ start:303 stop:1595 length:1293 start_codon:yes stop_codon:yes gene_type:complete
MFWPSKEEQIEELNRKWNESERFKGIKRNYTAEDVVALRGSLKIENTIATAGAERLWSLLNSDPYVSTFGALTGSQASQMVKAGLKSLYMSGWQVAGDGVGNTAGQTYPDQSLYPSNSVPTLVKTLNNALLRSDQISKLNGEDSVNWLAPIVADAEAGFGGPIHAFELMKNMIESGASGVHFEDQLAAEKKCGHMGGKVLVPTSQFINTLNAARLASDVLDVPTILIGRIDALDATLLTSDIDPRDRKFLTGERTAEGYFQVTGGMESTIGRGLAFAPYSDLLWFETSNPSLEEAKEFADAIHAEFPGKMMAYNCSPSFNWRANIDEKTTAEFRDQLAQMGYKYQFITLAGWHMINLNAFELAQEFKQEGMPAYVRLQDREFSQEENGYTATKHQQEVGAGFFDKVIMSITGGDSATTALAGSTESGQFN